MGIDSQGYRCPDHARIAVSHLDRVISGEHVGCVNLKHAVQRIKPKLHIFGHIHEGYGRLEKDGTIFVNVSLCNFNYRPMNLPVVVDLRLMGTIGKMKNRC